MANLIIKFDYTRLRNEAHVELNETFSTLVEKYHPSTLGILPLFQVYQPLLADEVSVLDVIRKSELTSEIIEQDHLRDGVFRGFVDAEKSALHHFNPAKREAARKLEVIFEHYGNIAAKTLDQETAAIDDLLRELLTDEHATCLALLGLTDWANQLNTENQKFKDLMMARYDEAAQRPTIRMKAARTAVDKAFRTILDQVEALVLVNGIQTYESFIRELNVVMERYKHILAQEKGRRTKVENEETTI
ncbi:MAG: hypothetical protein EZS26_000209 [Candidatus Ordinivivax streblomastigis]|uniref:Uncharacterized protein n=2 Tax=root TaxID=1 RepID=A0A5M8P5J5_9BACT|nr:MAG: hypothetical protein EZS26_000209 [Candidatus Ordinivivax streblomastigis]